MTVKTEDLGKIVEKTICLLYETPYIGNFKYDIQSSEDLIERFKKLLDYFPKCRHTAENGGRYDFTTDDLKHLSVKTSKKDGKVAPQVIGQTSPKKFCELVGIEYTNDKELKLKIQENTTNILYILEKYTFDCDITYYNKKKNTLRFIRLKLPIEWSGYNYEWTRKADSWNNSSTLKIKIDEMWVSLIEFQFHSKSRSNMAIRWNFENVLNVFKDNLDIIDL
jgi:hypothetical protein